jgi:excisionase family DNA binding protein
LPAGQSPTPPANSASSFPSLDFPPDRTVLHTLEVARRLNVSLQHVLDLIEAGKLRAVNVGGIGAKCRPYYRIPIEAWRAFVRQNTT